ncbi:hypothetical protein BH23CHL8_BH23CHL8_29820 [soil metagenome]
MRTKRWEGHGPIEWIPENHRYRVTDLGFRITLFFTHPYARLIRPAVAQLVDPCLADDPIRPCANRALPPLGVPDGPND